MQTLSFLGSAMWYIWLMIGPAGALAIAWWALGEYERRGHSVTYAAGILRAVGAGLDACKTAGVDPFSVAGRAIAIKAGADYLASQLPNAMKKLDITEADNVQKVAAQLSLVEVAMLAGSTGAALAGLPLPQAPSPAS